MDSMLLVSALAGIAVPAILFPPSGPGGGGAFPWPCMKLREVGYRRRWLG